MGQALRPAPGSAMLQPPLAGRFGALVMWQQVGPKRPHPIKVGISAFRSFKRRIGLPVRRFMSQITFRERWGLRSWLRGKPAGSAQR